MKIEYLGHSCFLMSEGKIKFLTDPYTGVGYEMPKVEADYITCSHDHFDHNFIVGVSGVKKVINSTGNFTECGIGIKGIPAFHDEVGGRKRGKSIVFCYQFKDLSVCHLGDIGETPSEELFSRLPRADVLMIPVGGKYTIDGKQAAEYVKAINPKIVIPMHFLTKRCGLDISGADEFLKYADREAIVLPELESVDAEKYFGKIVFLKERVNEER